MPDNRDELDRLLDSALATYGDPGAESGLEERILSRMAAEANPAPRRRWPAWAMVLPVAASLLFLLLLSRPGTKSAPVATSQNAQPASRRAAGLEAANQPSSHPTPIHRARALLRKPRLGRTAVAAQSAPLPKLEIFPSPQPLGPQEQALVDFAAHATKSERESLIAAKPQTDAPLRIAALEIKPLEPPAAGAN